MTTISAKVVLDTKYQGARVTTLLLRYPRSIHSELMTHRRFSRNASSSRAIPVRRLLQDVIDDPYTPLQLRANIAGMQPGERLPGWKEALSLAVIGAHRWASLATSWTLSKLGVHKQWANRYIEAHGHITVVLTSTEWKNFFDQRVSPYAQAEMNELAVVVQRALEASEPEVAPYHLPFLSEDEIVDIQKDRYADSGRPWWHVAAIVSAARCARTSYLNHDGTTPDIDKDIILGVNTLVAKGHWSPFEHQAFWDTDVDGSSLNGTTDSHERLALERNFYPSGWTQFRAVIGG